MTSSTFSLGEPASTTTPSVQEDTEADAEFEKVVDGLKETSIEEREPVSRRPSRPTPSAAERLGEHPLSPVTATSAPAASQPVHEEIPLSRCLFCNYDSPTWQLSLSHMARIHGLFIPEHTYLIDPEGLLRYFQAKITQNHECLLCHRLSTTTVGIQAHMRDKGHCSVGFETEEEMTEVGQFYDFSSTYSDAEDETSSDTEMDEPIVGRKSKSNGGVRLPTKKLASQGDGDEDVEDEGWETDSSFSSLDSAELTSVPIDDHSHQYERLSLHKHHSHTDARPHRSADGFHSHAHHHAANAVFHDDYELHLPNGRTVGHRSLRKYYRQNLHSYPSAAERQERAQQLLENDNEDGEDAEMEDIPDSPPMYRSQALARRHEAGLLGVTAAQRRDIRAGEKRGRRQGEHAKNRYQARLEKQANFQKHFRVSCPRSISLLFLD